MPELTDEQLAEIETTLCIYERPVRDVAPAVHDAATDLLAEVRWLRAQYDELRDALCSKAWAPRDNHERVVALATMMKQREAKIEAMRDGGEG